MADGGEEHFDAVVVGSGFGGSVVAARLAAAGLGVLVLERGRAYPPGAFPRFPAALQANVWNPDTGQYGLFDIRSFDGCDAVVASGLGGGSLIDANVMLRKDENWFVGDDRTGGGREPWPVTRADLDPHYDRVEAALGVRSYPLDTSPYDRTARTRDFRDAAADLGLDWSLPNLAVTFGNRGEAPVPGTPIREARPNMHRRPRQSCRLCGECVIGCNYGSKNTLDFTYLSDASHDGAEIRTLCEARAIRPREGGGWTLSYVQHEDRARSFATVHAERLVLCAGTFGTPHLLLRNRAALPRLDRLGEGFSTNGDLLSLVARHHLPDADGRRPGRERNPATGPVVTCAIRVADELDGGGIAGRGGYLEDGGYPDWAAPMLSLVGESGHAIAPGALPPASRLLLMLIAMGRDVPDGTMSLRDDELVVRWNMGDGSRPYFERLREVERQLATKLGGELVESPLTMAGRTMTVHPLGGARMGANAADSVVDAWGRVHGCERLYVADGSVMPGPVGANPALTIAALADRFSDAILDDAPSRRTSVPRRPASAATAGRAVGPVRGVALDGAPDVFTRLRQAHEQLAAHVSSNIRANGAVVADCESRVTESTLMLTLLRCEGLLPGVQASLRSYLGRRAPGAQIFDATVIDAVLKGTSVTDPDPILDRVLATSDDSGDDRDRLVLSAVLAAVEAAPFVRYLGPEAFDGRGEGPWTGLLVLAGAIGILYRAQYGPIDEHEVARLLGMLHARPLVGVWEQQVLTHLFALLALARARPGHPSSREGVRRLAVAQNADGGMPFIVSKTIFATATAGLALARAGAGEHVLAAIAGFLAGHQGPDGGWPLTEGVSQADVDSTSFAVLFLHAVGPGGHDSAVEGGRGYLRSMPGPDGGFPVFRGARASESWMTAAAVLALLTEVSADGLVPEAAVRFLLDCQRLNGTFGRSWSLSEAASTSLAVLALNAASTCLPALAHHRIVAATSAARRRLLGTANTDGGWGHTPAVGRSDPISSAYSLLALVPDHLQAPAVKGGIEYLLSQQRPHGGYVCRPDQVGPRPLPYTVPILADAFVLLAMARCKASPSN